MPVCTLMIALSLFAADAADPSPLVSREHPQWGRTPARNNVVTDTALEKTIPLTWHIGEFDFETRAWQPEKSKNIKWVARLGSNAFGNPVVASGKVFVGTNNDGNYLARFPADKVDLGVLLCFNESDGRFQWQYSAAKLNSGDKNDYAATGICSSPLVEGDRVYLLTNRCEVVCLDVNGFHDGRNDGAVQDEENQNKDEADVIWRYDMIKELGVVPVFMTASSITALDGVLYIQTCNSADEKAKEVPNPAAPSFIALDRKTGKLLWKDNSPGENILHGSWSSPAIDIKHRQVIFAGGDAWLYGFTLPESREAGRATVAPEFAWSFDANRKAAVWMDRGQGDRTSIIATPVVADDHLYIATGQITEHASTQAALLCLDLAKARLMAGDDVSDEAVFNPKVDGGRVPLAPKRLRNADPEAGDVTEKNPHSALAWRYEGNDLNKNGKLDFAEMFHRSISTVAVKDGLVFAVDFVGIVHCVDAKTGKAHWTHDMLGGSWCSPLILNNRVYIGNDSGMVLVFALSKEKKILAENDMGQTLYSTPVVANGVMFIATKSNLFAIETMRE